VLAARGFRAADSSSPWTSSCAPGEVLGLAGLLGSGRTELARLLFALDASDSGELSVDGKPAKIDHPADALQLGLGFCPEDRKESGIVAELSVRENIALRCRRAWARKVPQAAEQRALAEKLVAALGVKTPASRRPSRSSRAATSRRPSSRAGSRRIRAC
jgi:simple sugar transport system ATP-binding protein